MHSLSRPGSSQGFAGRSIPQEPNYHSHGTSEYKWNQYSTEIPRSNSDANLGAELSRALLSSQVADCYRTERFVNALGLESLNNTLQADSIYYQDTKAFLGLQSISFEDIFTELKVKARLPDVVGDLPSQVRGCRYHQPLNILYFWFGRFFVVIPVEPLLSNRKASGGQPVDRLSGMKLQEVGSPISTCSIHKHLKFDERVRDNTSIYMMSVVTTYELNFFYISKSDGESGSLRIEIAPWKHQEGSCTYLAATQHGQLVLPSQNNSTLQVLSGASMINRAVKLLMPMLDVPNMSSQQATIQSQGILDRLRSNPDRVACSMLIDDRADLIYFITRQASKSSQQTNPAPDANYLLQVFEWRGDRSKLALKMPEIGLTGMIVDRFNTGPGRLINAELRYFGRSFETSLLLTFDTAVQILISPNIATSNSSSARVWLSSQSSDPPWFIYRLYLPVPSKGLQMGTKAANRTGERHQDDQEPVPKLSCNLHRIPNSQGKRLTLHASAADLDFVSYLDESNGEDRLMHYALRWNCEEKPNYVVWPLNPHLNRNEELRGVMEVTAPAHVRAHASPQTLSQLARSESVAEGSLDHWNADVRSWFYEPTTVILFTNQGFRVLKHLRLVDRVYELMQLAVDQYFHAFRKKLLVLLDTYGGAEVTSAFIQLVSSVNQSFLMTDGSMSQRPVTPQIQEHAQQFLTHFACISPIEFQNQRSQSYIQNGFVKALGRVLAPIWEASTVRHPSELGSPLGACLAKIQSFSTLCKAIPSVLKQVTSIQSQESQSRPKSGYLDTLKSIASLRNHIYAAQDAETFIVGTMQPMLSGLNYMIAFKSELLSRSALLKELMEPDINVMLSMELPDLYSQLSTFQKHMLIMAIYGLKAPERQAVYQGHRAPLQTLLQIIPDRKIVEKVFNMVWPLHLAIAELMNNRLPEAQSRLEHIQPLLDKDNARIVLYLEPIFCAAHCVPEYFRLLGRAHELCRDFFNREFLQYAQEELTRLIHQVRKPIGASQTFRASQREDRKLGKLSLKQKAISDEDVPRQVLQIKGSDKTSRWFMKELSGLNGAPLSLRSYFNHSDSRGTAEWQQRLLKDTLTALLEVVRHPQDVIMMFQWMASQELFQFVNSYKKESLLIVLHYLDLIPFDERSAMKFLSTCLEDVSLGKHLKADLYYHLALIKPQKEGKLREVNIILRHEWMEQALSLLGNDPAGEPSLRSRVLSALKETKVQKQLLIALKDRLWMLESSFELSRAKDEDRNLLLVTNFEEWDTGKLVQSYIEKLTGERSAFRQDLIRLYQEVAFQHLPLEMLQRLSSEYGIFEIQVIIQIGAKPQNARLTPENLLRDSITSFLRQTDLKNKASLLMPSRHDDEMAILKSMVANYILFHPTGSANQDPTPGSGALLLNQVVEDIERASSWINGRATARPTAYGMIQKAQELQSELWWIPRLFIGSQTATTLPIVCNAYLILARLLVKQIDQYKAEFEMVIKVACTLFYLSCRRDLPDLIQHQSSQYPGIGFGNTTYPSPSQLAKGSSSLKSEMRHYAGKLLELVEDRNNNRTRNEMIPEALEKLGDIVNQTTQSQTASLSHTRAQFRESIPLTSNATASTNRPKLSPLF